ncbi:hypothetical protein IQ268_11320 [Oculatella sp. LEGE 06141]|uniref:hypothetical protein n=1 Tax=Oculatella sp. LEGE 06141 TaxID=1828648 RepID=UPI00187FA821|nr:hypothetical protein [Oculatella sp. LEGE 06141]MBE9179150.1 hypothetical protein [Oculatella sp. LEGE 06141]
MRYSIMLQLVTLITFILVSTAALFAWLQNRQVSTSDLEGGAIERSRHSSISV